MSLGVFLDIDGVLTPKPINMQYAFLLGVETELAALEQKWAIGEIGNDDFNAEFIPLFRQKGFSKDFAVDNFDRITFNTWAAELVQVNLPEAYFVTSGPSYFVHPLARKLNIPPNNVICSNYDFDENGLLERCTSPSGPLDKARFVQLRAARYSTTIGIGDTPDQDGQFLGECDIGILMGGERMHYLNATDLKSVVSIIKCIRDLVPAPGTPQLIPTGLKEGVAALMRESTYETNVFIMTPFVHDARYNTAISTIKKELHAGGYRGWTANEQDLVPDLWANVCCYMYGCKYGIALITANEISDGETITVRKDVLNPNVVA